MRIATLAAVLCVSLVRQALSPASPGTITTIAGGGTGEGIPARFAPLSLPTALAVDGDGNIYVADTVHNKILKIDPAGNAHTFAGTGEGDFGGDGGPAVNAELLRPEGLAADGYGNLFVSDTGNHRARKVDAAGIITTVAGLGVAAYAGDGLHASLASLSEPDGLAVAPDGSLLIADSGNHVVRRIDPSGTITTIAGIGLPGAGPDHISARLSALNRPSSVLVTQDGSIYIADTFNHRVRRINSDGSIITVAGNLSPGFSGDGGPAHQASLRFPETLAMSSSGLLIGDSLNRRVRLVDSAGVISTVAGNGSKGLSGDGGPALSAAISGVSGMVALDDGAFIFSDATNNRIRRVARDGIIDAFAGSGEATFVGDGLHATDVPLLSPTDAVKLPNGDLLIVEAAGHRVRAVSAGTGVISTFAGSGVKGFNGDGGAASAARLASPSRLAVGPDGSVYISDSNNNRVRRVDLSGNITTVAGGGSFVSASVTATSASLLMPSGIDFDEDGNLYIADAGRHRIVKVDPSGWMTVIAGGSPGFAGDNGPATSARFQTPTGLDVAPDGSIYIADHFNHRIRRISPDGIITTVAGTGASCYYGEGGPATDACLSYPAGVVATGGGFLISDAGNHRIREVDELGIIRTIVGNGYYGSSGDGKAASEAALMFPVDLSIDASGNLLICDSQGGRTRLVAAGW